MTKILDKGKYKRTLCWDCANATNSGCSWSRSLDPVEGWTAVEDEMLTNYKNKKTFFVIECPQFIPDSAVRCQECKFFEVKGITTCFGYCTKKEVATDVYWSCEFAERAEND